MIFKANKKFEDMTDCVRELLRELRNGEAKNVEKWGFFRPVANQKVASSNLVSHAFSLKNGDFSKEF